MHLLDTLVEKTCKISTITSQAYMRKHYVKYPSLHLKVLQFSFKGVSENSFLVTATLLMFPIDADFAMKTLYLLRKRCYAE